MAETGKTYIFKNKTFAEKYKQYLKYQIAKVDHKLTHASDKDGPAAFMTLLINYSLYRKLFSDEDPKIYKAIWLLQKKCPIIILYNNLTIVPGNFLKTKTPLMKPTKCDPPALMPFMKE